MLELRAAGILRSNDRVWCLAEGPEDKPAVVLSRTKRYSRIPAAAKALLQDLANRTAGMTVAEARERHPLVDLPRLHTLGLVDYVPPEGTPPRGQLVSEMWWRNINAQALLQSQRWNVIASKMTEPGIGRSPSARPLAFDDLETAARRSFALPGTSKQCTAVSLSLCSALRRRGYAARITLFGTHDASLFHAAATVDRHIIDPADALIDAHAFVLLEELPLGIENRQGRARHEILSSESVGS